MPSLAAAPTSPMQVPKQAVGMSLMVTNQTTVTTMLAKRRTVNRPAQLSTKSVTTSQNPPTHTLADTRIASGRLVTSTDLISRYSLLTCANL